MSFDFLKGADAPKDQRYDGVGSILCREISVGSGETFGSLRWLVF